MLDAQSKTLHIFQINLHAYIPQFDKELPFLFIGTALFM